jgi:hypothetical protein
MIKIDYKITFPDAAGLATVTPPPSEIAEMFIACRIEASSRNCIFFSETNNDGNERVASFIWENQTALDDYTQWAETTYQYSTVYQQYVSLIEQNGGTIIRTSEEF